MQEMNTHEDEYVRTVMQQLTDEVRKCACPREVHFTACRNFKSEFLQFFNGCKRRLQIQAQFYGTPQITEDKTTDFIRNKYSFWKRINSMEGKISEDKVVEATIHLIKKMRVYFIMRALVRFEDLIQHSILLEDTSEDMTSVIQSIVQNMSIKKLFGFRDTNIVMCALSIKTVQKNIITEIRET